MTRLVFVARSSSPPATPKSRPQRHEKRDDGAVVMFGDDEVTLEHAIALYRALPNAELAVVPGTSHGLLVEKPELCNSLIVDFLTTEPVPTFAPIRRAST